MRRYLLVLLVFVLAADVEADGGHIAVRINAAGLLATRSDAMGGAGDRVRRVKQPLGRLLGEKLPFLALAVVLRLGDLSGTASWGERGVASAFAGRGPNR